MTIDIYVREKSGSREIRFPILPEDFQFPTGDATFITNEIMNKGEVAVPSGTELATYSWESEFPGEQRSDDPMIRGTWQDPNSYKNTLEDWKSKGTLLNLLITGYSINVDVYCKEFHPMGTGAFGDISYEIQFIEARSITIKTEKVEAKKTTQRQTSTAKTYTIVSGDTLWEIAKKFYGDGSKWPIIYDANKEIIEKTAKEHGKSSSENGHWIYPGVTLTIPDISSSSSKETSKSKDTGKTTPKSTEEKEKQYEEDRDAGVDEMVNKVKVGGKGKSNLPTRVDQIM